MVVRGTPDTAESRAAAGQIRKDFERLQVLRNEIARALVARQTLDYKSIQGKAAEINKRASRLMTALLVANVDGSDANKDSSDPAARIDESHLDRSLVVLCKTIDRFVENPVFDLNGVVDVNDSTKAGGDLLDVIELSDDIRRAAEHLREHASER